MISAGVCLLLKNHRVSPVDLALAIEDRGFASLFVPENTHMPVQRRHASPYPEDRMRILGGLPDPFVTLSACAAVTKRIRLGVSVCLLTHRDAIATAKSASSLDAISDGRFILGVAGGRIAEAMENHGASFKHRWKIVREKTLAMRAIWNQDEPEFHGEYVDFNPIIANTKPLQEGGPPIWIGSNSAAVPDRVADYADGWIVFDGRYEGDAIADLKSACEQRDREVDEISIVLMDPPQEIAGLQQRYNAGFRDFIFMVTVDQVSEVERSLDKLARLTEKLDRLN